MKDYVNIGPSPNGEDCVQVGDLDYSKKARSECMRYIELLRKNFGNEPEGARLSIKSESHDFGSYYEVVCYYDDTYPESVEYAYNCESNSPEFWESK